MAERYIQGLRAEMPGVTYHYTPTFTTLQLRTGRSRAEQRREERSDDVMTEKAKNGASSIQKTGGDLVAASYVEAYTYRCNLQVESVDKLYFFVH